MNYSRTKDVSLRPSQHLVNRTKCFPVSRPSFFVLASPTQLARPSLPIPVPSILRWSCHSTECWHNTETGEVYGFLTDRPAHSHRGGRHFLLLILT